MSYGYNYYNYQIAVIFAILIVALLVLGAFILGIYYTFVVNTRNKKGGAGGGARTRTPSSGPATRTTWQAAQPVQPPATPYSPNDYPRTAVQTTDYGYDPRTASQQAYAQQGYAQQTYTQQQQQQSYGGDYAVKVRELQPEYVYQQGPVTWTNTQSVHESGAYPISPVQQIQGTTTTTQQAAAYHMSSV